MALTLYLLRNGETLYCRTGRYCSADGVSLTTRGEQMARHFALTYESVQWKAIFSSPLHHAIATAQPLCEQIGQPLQYRDGLRELDFGHWEGLSPHQVKNAFHDDYIRWLADPAWNAPTGGEKGIRVSRRSSAVLDEIEETFPDGNVLIVSHKATLRILLCTLLGIDIGRYRDRLDMPEAAVTIIEMADYGPFIQVLNDCSYLPSYLHRPLPGTHYGAVYEG